MTLLGADAVNPMKSVRYWILASAIAALILLSPIVAYLMLLAAEILIDVLMEAGTRAVLTLLMIGALGWLVSRKQSPPSYGASQFEDDPSSEEPSPVPARPM